MRRLLAACTATLSLILAPMYAGAEVTFEVDRFTGSKKINMDLDCKGISQYARGHDVPSCYLYSNGKGYRSIAFSVTEEDWILLDSAIKDLSMQFLLSRMAQLSAGVWSGSGMGVLKTATSGSLITLSIHI
jgi:hypothetical protein